MSKTLVIFGATGQQGGAVLDFVLKDNELSQQYSIRAVTRDVKSEKAKHLAEKVSVVQGDTADKSSLENALHGAHTVFAMTTPSLGPNAFEEEYSTAKRIADVAVEQGVQYFIFSTLPSVSKISNGKYTNIVPFDAKAAAEEYIRGLPIKSSQTFLAPKQSSDGTWILSRTHSSRTRYPLIAMKEDGGKFVGAILAEPEKFEGKRLCAATAFYDIEEIVASLSKSSGRTIKHKQVPDVEFIKETPVMPDLFAEYFHYWDEFGYFGEDSENLVAWAAGHARGKLTTFDEFLVKHPFRLE
ncbi:hypothetical protein M409DRAFT_68864 [Zasmidium cellare ATCC 36951]|uniref:NmrA-like domain-containing protein n=1 Tax=Zasmidium cellare ATCC 36951 TaxID=1080233 RepID=A0A6A6C7S6_ZASCE|nr:uncharacterized protein M409DRAFT_68864 [Zasmidium cellare ATCC 36951]KAF2162903.1 hypothetical protein M409DRAFT_68864 [Zasmidium cellare ATCC 36951]